MIKLAFDIGGTFTDFVLQDYKTQKSYFLKISSTPSNPEMAVLSGLNQLIKKAKTTLTDVDAILHATTIATNAVLERKGASTALITTKGFRDVLIIGRQKRYETYDLYINKPKPLVERKSIFEVLERTDYDGSISTPLDYASLDEAVKKIIELNVASVAISLIHSYANPSHENVIRDTILRRAPQLSISVSSEISPKLREYERTNTAVANAYVQPILDRYIARLESALAKKGFKNDLFIMQSNGGLVSPKIARHSPIRVVESGPAAGVLMGGVVGERVGEKHIITFDMGGTTAKLGAVDNGRPAISPTFEIGHVQFKKGSGLPINVPSVELIEIGAGGGSIASVNMGIITIGPESAGANPGPICYGLGGKHPTVTDANVILGYISPDGFNSGKIKLDVERARLEMVTQIAEPLNLSLERAAWGVHAVATKNMENALRIVSIERGRDPRRYSMVAFGGAGPLHASRLAKEIGIPKVIIPFAAGLGSAIGLLEAQPKIDMSTTELVNIKGFAYSRIAEIFDELEQRIKKDLDRLGVKGDCEVIRQASMRYVGQGFEISVDLPSGYIGPSYNSLIKSAFENAYLKKHKFLDADAEIEGLDWTLIATITNNIDSHNNNNDDNEAHFASLNAKKSRPVWFPEMDDFIDTRTIDRRALPVDKILTGPALVEDADCTTLVLPNDTVRKHKLGHLIIEIHPDKLSEG
ncbi:MAG: hydantoinase/oxoprolinase family protein [Pseudomonadota bacterium]|nr:hydantoinase/oxoprolinase family protein [Pseudomonadota bacterium]